MNFRAHIKDIVSAHLLYILFDASYVASRGAEGEATGAAGLKLRLRAKHLVDL